MKPVRFVSKVFRSYEFGDWMISLMAVVIFLLMILKMMIFPYGVFGFGESNIYTEGLVSRTGFQTINPLFVDYNEADREVSRLVFSGLMKYDPTQREIVEDMGKLVINETKTEYTFTLREGLKWHDGKSLTANDVYFTFHDVIQDPTFSNQILKANFSGVEIVQIDERTVRFILEKPNIFFKTNLTIGILPKHLLEDVAPVDLLQAEFNQMPIGSGPYMFSSPVETENDGRMQVTLQRNPYYYNEPSEIEFIRFIAFSTFDDLIEQSNIINGVVRLSGPAIANFKNDERFELLPYELPQYMAVFMNMESEILQEDQLVRLALQKAIDKKELIGNLSEKKIVDTPLMELSQEDWVYQSSTEEAQGALKDSGFEYAEEDTEKMGIRYNEDGEALEVNLIARLYDEGTYQYEESIEAITFMTEAWEGIGFNVITELLPVDQFEQRIMLRDYDLLYVGQSLGYNLDTYSYWHSTQADPMGQNFSNYKSFQVDSLIEDIRSVFNQEKRTRELNELAERIKEDVPAIFLFRPVYYYASDGKVTGISMDGVVFPSDRFVNVSSWSFK